jgi:hypothetical protein
MKTSSLLCLFVAILSLPLAGCIREGSPEQISAFNNAVAFESQTHSIPGKQASYMKVVAMGPDTKYGKAASERVEQLNRQLESITGSLNLK